MTLSESQSVSTHPASGSKEEGASQKPRLYIVLHTIKYAFAKWCSILPFERFMHCLGSRAEEEEEEAVWWWWWWWW